MAVTRLITWKADAESSPEVGSSRKMRLGAVTSSQAIDSRLFCPPANVNGR